MDFPYNTLWLYALFGTPRHRLRNLGISRNFQNGEIVPDYEKHCVEIFGDLLRHFHRDEGVQEEIECSPLFAGFILNGLAYYLDLIDTALYAANRQEDNPLLLPTGRMEILPGSDVAVPQLKNFGTRLDEEKQRAALLELLAST